MVTTPSPGARKVVRDFFAQRWNAARCAVAVAAGSDCVANGVHNGCGRMKIRFAEFEMDDGAALLFEFLGARKNGEGTFAGKL